MCQHIYCQPGSHGECPVYWNGRQEDSKPSQIMMSCYDRSGSLEGIPFLLLLSSSDGKAFHLSPKRAYVHGHGCLLHVYVVVYRYACVHHTVCACGGQRAMFDVFLYCSPLCFLKKGLSLNPELSCLARLSG